MRQVLLGCVAYGRLAVNPADYVKLPNERSAAGGIPGVVDDPDMFLTAAQMAALVDATPWPYSVMVNLAAWSGQRAAELAGLQVGDVEVPESEINRNTRPTPGMLHVQRTGITIDGALVCDSPTTIGSRRRVPLWGRRLSLDPPIDLGSGVDFACAAWGWGAALGARG